MIHRSKCAHILAWVRLHHGKNCSNWTDWVENPPNKWNNCAHLYLSYVHFRVSDIFGSNSFVGWNKTSNRTYFLLQRKFYLLFWKTCLGVNMTFDHVWVNERVWTRHESLFLNFTDKQHESRLVRSEGCRNIIRAKKNWERRGLIRPFREMFIYLSL